MVTRFSASAGVDVLPPISSVDQQGPRTTTSHGPNSAHLTNFYCLGCPNSYGLCCLIEDFCRLTYFRHTQE
jgi:hypothetical protein